MPHRLYVQRGVDNTRLSISAQRSTLGFKHDLVTICFITIVAGTTVWYAVTSQCWVNAVSGDFTMEVERRVAHVCNTAWFLHFSPDQLKSLKIEMNLNRALLSREREKWTFTSWSEVPKNFLVQLWMSLLTVHSLKWCKMHLSRSHSRSSLKQVLEKKILSVKELRRCVVWSFKKNLERQTK